MDYIKKCIGNAVEVSPDDFYFQTTKEKERICSTWDALKVYSVCSSAYCCTPNNAIEMLHRKPIIIIDIDIVVKVFGRGDKVTWHNCSQIVT